MAHGSAFAGVILGVETRKKQVGDKEFIDLDTEVAPESKGHPEELLSSLNDEAAGKQKSLDEYLLGLDLQ